MKPNDIYRWHYTDEYLEKINHGKNNGTTYWCRSQICICKETQAGLRLYDTFWNSDNERVEPTDKDIVLRYLGNLDDYRKVEEYSAKYYNPDDLLNLNHRNNTKGNLYVKKDAKRDFNTVRKYIQKEIEEKEYKAKSAAEDVIRYKKVLDELTEDNLDKVWI